MLYPSLTVTAKIDTVISDTAVHQPVLLFSQLDELIMTILHSLQCKIGTASPNYPRQQFILSKGGNSGFQRRQVDKKPSFQH